MKEKQNITVRPETIPCKVIRKPLATTHQNPDNKNFPPLPLQQKLATTADLAVGNYQSRFSPILAMSTSEDFTLVCAVTPDRQNLACSTFFTATVGTLRYQDWTS